MVIKYDSCTTYVWVSSTGKFNSVYLQANLLVEALNSAGAQASILTPDSGGVYELFCIIFKANRIVWHFSSFDKWLLPLIFSKRLSYVYHNITPSKYFVRSAPLVALLAFLGRLQLRIIPKTRKWIAVSKYNAAELLKLGFEDVEYSPCIIKNIVGRGCSSRKTVAPSVFYNGRIVENKNCLELLSHVNNASRLLGERVKFFILGDGNLRRSYFKKFSNMVANIEKEGNVEIVWTRSGVVDEDLVEIYAKSWVYVSMSTHEGFGLPVFESVLNDTPALYLQCGGTESLMQDFGLVKIENASNYYKVLRDLLTSPEARMALLVSQKKVVESCMEMNRPSAILGAYGHILANADVQSVKT